jgi:hypothetical protein
MGACGRDSFVDHGGVGLAADGAKDAAAFGDLDADEEVEGYCGEDGGPGSNVSTSTGRDIWCGSAAIPDRHIVEDDPE